MKQSSTKKASLYGYKATTTIQGKPVTLWLAVPPPTAPAEFVLLPFAGKTRGVTASWEPSYAPRPTGSIRARRLDRWGGLYMQR